LAHKSIPRRTATPLAVLVFLLVRRAVSLAAPADVDVAIDDASAVERAAQALAELVFLGAHLAVGAREEERSLGRVERLFEERDERSGDRNRFLASALGGLAIVRPAHHQEATLQVDVALA
jgi:hypothetical protein